jgi:hypothetical protein
MCIVGSAELLLVCAYRVRDRGGRTLTMDSMEHRLGRAGPGRVKSVLGWSGLSLFDLGIFRI